MPKKRYKAKEIVAKLRQVDVHLSRGSSVTDAIRQNNVSGVTYCRRRKQRRSRSAPMYPGIFCARYPVFL